MLYAIVSVENMRRELRLSYSIRLAPALIRDQRIRGCIIYLIFSSTKACDARYRANGTLRNVDSSAKLRHR